MPRRELLTFRWVCRKLLPCLLFWLGPGGLSADDALTGEQIYQKQCAACHGAKGEGVIDGYAKALVGDRPLDDLARVIEKTMPKDEAEKCVGEDARKVAAYIYEAFYSKAAQIRNSRPRVELARLTVRQYRNAVADLVGGFREPGVWDGERGLRGEYFNDKHFRRDKRVLERRDPTIDFNFGEASPVADQIDAKDYSIRWEGAVLAPDTGEYEFTLKTENGAKLFVNDMTRPLVDAWVKSGDETEHREAIQLLGGRVYPLRVEFFKSKDGKQERGSIALLWKPPHRAVEPVPERNLSPKGFPETLAVQTPFPPDDRSTGYERGASISKAWDQSTTYAAIEVAGHVVSHLERLANVKADAPDRAERLREFCRRFAERAFRRPLSDEQKALFIDRQFAETGDVDAAVKKVVLLVLKSPRFLYREVGSANPQAPDAYDTASRMSFALWDSLPDQQLLEAAAGGELAAPEQIAGQAERILADLRTRSKLREFFEQWLKIDQVHDLAKDRERFPEFDERTASDLRTSLDLFLEDVAWSETSDFRQLLLADYLYLNGRLAPLYGANLPPEAPFNKVALDPSQRAGVLSHPFLLARFAYASSSSPIHRGVFVVRSLLGRTLRPPPEAVVPLSPELHADLSTRERVALQTSPESCLTCHAIINPLGFSLEHYDAAGRYRTEEQNKPIDDTGFYQTLAGQKVDFHGARELAAFLASSEETQAAFVEQLFHYFVKQPVRAFGGETPEQLRRSFVEHDFNIRRLLVDLTVASAGKPPTPE
ncbi:MAG TPA: DUF1592 domain-containing protein [Pirellulales bacterium]|nr:DUF1592 domain-containing protein [Pirellulales bacterium]